MKKAVLSAVIGAGVLVIGAAPILAHHSGAMFDREKEVTLVGTIKEFQYTNPHSWLMVTVVQDGKSVDWGFEAEGPSSLLRAGIKKSMLAPGEKVTVKGRPMKDGRPAGGLISVTKADGSVLSPQAALRRGPGGKPLEAVTQE